MAEMKQGDGWYGDRITMKKSENIEEFLSRVLPSKTSSDVAPWIQIHSKDKIWKDDDDSSASENGFNDFLTEADNAKEYAKKCIQNLEGRTLKSVGSECRAKILCAAGRHGITSGKWLLFPTIPEDIDEKWKIIARETYAGTLGTRSKILTMGQTHDARPQAQVICVYTRDFRNIPDVARVCKRLVELGCGSYTRDGGKSACAISYKPCALTYADLNSGNEYRVNPVIYRRDDNFEALLNTGGIVERDFKEAAKLKKSAASARKRKSDEPICSKGRNATHQISAIIDVDLFDD